MARALFIGAMSGAPVGHPGRSQGEIKNVEKQYDEETGECSLYAPPNEKQTLPKVFWILFQHVQSSLTFRKNAQYI